MALHVGSASAVALALALGALTASQDLSEVAAREKKRREAARAQGPSRSFSDENLKAKASGWHWFGGAGYGFHAFFPTAPRVEDEVDIVGAIRIPRRRYVATSAGYAYSVLVKSRPKGAGLGDETLLNRLQAEARSDAAGEILASSRLAGQLCPGVEFRVRVQRGARERIVLHRAFACAQQLLTVAAECCATDGQSEVAEPDESPPDGSPPDGSPPEETAPDETAPDETAPGDGAPGEGTPDQRTPDESTAAHFLEYFVLEAP